MTRISPRSLAASTSQGASPTLDELLPRFRRHLEAENKAPRTIASYAEAVVQLDDFLTRAGMPRRVASITSEHIESFIVDQLERLRPTSARIRYASIRQFFRWAKDVGEIPASPMADMRPPAVPEQEVPVIPMEDLRKLIRACEADTDFLGRRDAALVRMFLDTGARLAEVAGLKVSDLDLDSRLVAFLAKGRRPRTNPYDPKTGRALDRYLLVRRRHPDADVPQLWLGTQGPLTSGGVAEAIKRRAVEAGIGPIHVHQLRHTVAHDLRMQGVDDASTMRLLGWRDPAMLHRYGASAADERARAAHRDKGLGSRL